MHREDSCKQDFLYGQDYFCLLFFNLRESPDSSLCNHRTPQCLSRTGCWQLHPSGARQGSLASRLAALPSANASSPCPKANRVAISISFISNLPLKGRISPQTLLLTRTTPMCNVAVCHILTFDVSGTVWNSFKTSPCRLYANRNISEPTMAT